MPMVSFIKYILLFFFIASCNALKPKMPLEKAQHAILKRHYKEAKKILERIDILLLTQEEENYYYFYKGEIAFIDLKKIKEAVENYEKIKISTIKNTSFKEKVLERIAEINFTFFKRWEKSIKDYKELAKVTKDIKKRDFYRFRMAVALFETGKMVLARQEFHQIVKNRKSLFAEDAHFFYAKTFFVTQKWKEASIEFNNYIKTKSDKYHDQAKFLLANVYEEQEKLEQAYNIYHSLLKTHPNPEIIMGRMEAVYKRKKARKR